MLLITVVLLHMKWNCVYNYRLSLFTALGIPILKKLPIALTLDLQFSLRVHPHPKELCVKIVKQSIGSRHTVCELFSSCATN